MNESAKMVLVLVSVCAISALVLSIIYDMAHPKIVENRQKSLEDAIKRVQPTAQKVEATGNQNGHIKEIFKLSDNDGKQEGYAVLIEFTGFGGPIRTVYGLDMDETITGVEVLEHTETPGLGTKITEVQFLEKFKDKKVDEMGIDTITGATISSSAIIEGITKSLNEFQEVEK